MKLAVKLLDRLRLLQKVAHADWIAARVLWNLGFFRQPIWLLQQSIEKYLKALWAKENLNSFKTEAHLEQELVKISKSKTDPHDYSKVFQSLPASVKDKLAKHPIYMIRTAALRYAVGSGLGYGDKIFRFGEKLIKDVRILIGEQPKRNFLEEWKAEVFDRGPTKRAEVDKIRKAILSLKNPPNTKKMKRLNKLKMQRLVEYMLNNVIKQ